MVEDISNSLYSFNNENNASLDKLYSQLSWNDRKKQSWKIETSDESEYV